MTERERRFVIGGGIAVALILALVLLPRLTGGAGDDAEQLAAERVARVRGLAESLDTLRVAARNAAAAERRVTARYLEGTTPQVAAAQLSAVIQEVADAAQVEVLREGSLPPREVGQATAIPLQIVARSDLPGLLDFLAGLERAAILLTIEDLTVSGDPRENSGVASLTLTLQITGYLLQSQAIREGA